MTRYDNRETCVICGMIANVDPWLHAERYAHEPEVVRYGRRLRHDGSGTFTLLVPEGRQSGPFESLFSKPEQSRACGYCGGLAMTSTGVACPECGGTGFAG